MFKQGMIATALALGAVSVAGPATAQQDNRSLNQQAGLVNVSVGNVILQDILTDAEINVLNDLNLITDNQIVVQAPINIAANVCNVAVNVLARGGPSRAAPCTAEQGSAALANLIRRQHLSNR